jgi:hypothetical protein
MARAKDGVQVRLLVDYKDPETSEVFQANTCPHFEKDVAAALVGAKVADHNPKAIAAGEQSSEHKAYLARLEAAEKKRRDD